MLPKCDPSRVGVVFIGMHGENLQSEFLIGEWRFSTATGLVARGDESRRLEPRAIQVLMHLVEHRNRFVSRDELFDSIWPDRTVTDDSLTTAVRQIRRAFDDDPRAARFIATRKNVGYRLIAAVQPVPRKRWRALGIGAGAFAAIVLIGVILSVTGTTQRMAPQSIAVMPFVHLNPEQEPYLAEVFSDGLSNALGNQQQTRVIARESVIALSDKLEPLGIAEALRADLLIAGTVLVGEDAVRVSARLIDPQTNEDLWSAQFDRPLGDLLVLQSDLSLAIAAQIGASLDFAASTGNGKAGPSTSELLEARHHLTVGRFDDAQSRYQQVLEAFPDSAEAHLGLAETALATFKRRSASPDLLATGLRHAMSAETLGYDSAPLHATIGQLELFRFWDFASAEARYLRAIAINPSHYTARRRYAWLLVAQLRHEEAAAQLQYLATLHPQYAQGSEMAVLKLYQGKPNDAIAQLKRLAASHSLDGPGRRALFMAHIAAGDTKLANEALRAFVVAGGWATLVEAASMATFSTDELLEWILETGAYESPVAAAGYASLLGRFEEAVRYLELAVARHDPTVVYLAAIPELRGLRQMPEFQQVLATLGLDRYLSVAALADYEADAG